MKILLLGEYSGVHVNLRDGLRAIGHAACVAGSGDGWKEIETDISIQFKTGFNNAFQRYFKLISNIKNFIGYDIVQFINPMPFGLRPTTNIFLVEWIRKRNKKSFLLAAGSDSYYWSVARRYLRYSPHEDELKYDQRGKKNYWLELPVMAANERLAKQVDGIIPILYDYAVGYQGFKNLLPAIQIPINLEKISYTENNLRGPLVVYHGLNREGFKGTRHVRNAFARLKEKYPNDLELIIGDRLPLAEYEKILQRVNVVVDQTSSYGWGVNAVLSLAKGKLVLSGAEPEALDIFGLSSSPIINILPDPEDIEKKIEAILEKRSELSALGWKARQYVEEHHDHIKIAKHFLDQWSK